MAVSEICSIIEACGKANVAELKFGGLYLRMEPKAPVPNSLAPSLEAQENLELPYPAPTAAEIAEIQLKEQKRSLERDEIAIREQQLADMWIEDPARAEELLIQGELEDGEPELDEEA